MTVPPTDAQLLRARDREAWDSLYLTTARTTYRILSHLTGAQSSTLEELNQEVWLAAIESIEKWDESRGPVRDWVLGIARNRGLLYLRKLYRRRMVVAADVMELPATSAAEPGNVDLDEQRLLLRASIESLPETWQWLLRKKYDEGLSVKQIADLAESTPKAIESTLFRARHRLKTIVIRTLSTERDR